jgi:hypothetical protein
MAGPAAVKIVTFRMTVGREENGRYVLGNGLALGSERPPLSLPNVRAALSRRGISEGAACDGNAVTGVGDVWVDRVVDEQAAIPARTATPRV